MEDYWKPDGDIKAAVPADTKAMDDAQIQAKVEAEPGAEDGAKAEAPAEPFVAIKALIAARKFDEASDAIDSFEPKDADENAELQLVAADNYLAQGDNRSAQQMVAMANNVPGISDVMRGKITARLPKK